MSADAEQATNDNSGHDDSGGVNRGRDGLSDDSAHPTTPNRSHASPSTSGPSGLRSQVGGWFDRQAVTVMFGLVVRFELKDATAAAAFDRLVAATSEDIQAAEPGTLMYVTNRMEGAPLSRLFYEIYTDRSAFEAHEATAHVRHFRAEREAYVASLRVEFVTPTGGKNGPS